MEEVYSLNNLVNEADHKNSSVTRNDLQQEMKVLRNTSSHYFKQDGQKQSHT